MEEQVIGAVIGDSVADYAVGNLDFTLAIDQTHVGPVAGEVEEGSRSLQAAKFFGAHEPFQSVERKRAHTANIHPGAHHGKDVRVSKFRKRFVKFKSTYSHRHILPD